MINYQLKDLFNQDSVHKELVVEWGYYDNNRDWIVEGSATNEDLHQENFTLKESLCSQNQLKFGVESSEVRFRVSNIFQPLKGKRIRIKTILDGNTDNPFYIGEYIVYSDIPTADRSWRDIVAYDRLYNTLTKDFSSWYNNYWKNKQNAGVTTVTLKMFRNDFFKNRGIIQEDIYLPNDSIKLEKTINADSLSGKDILTALCELNGCFGKINRNGKFEYVFLERGFREELYPAETLYPAEGLYPSEPVGETIYKSFYKSAKYEDFETKPISKVRIRTDEEDVGSVFPAEEITQDDNVYDIVGNFLVFGKSESDLQTILYNICSKVLNITYRPFSVECIGNPCREVGDIVRLSTKNQIIISYVLERTLKGIQSLKDSISSKGVENYSEPSQNLVSRQIAALKSTSNKLIRTSEETVSKIETITQEQESLATEIKQTSENIVVSVDKNGNIVSKLSLGENGVAFDGNFFVISANNLTLDKDGNAVFSGKLTSPSGEIGAWSIDNSGLSAEGVGVYITTRSTSYQATLYDGKLIFGSLSDSHIPDTDNGYIDVSKSGIFAKTPGSDSYSFAIDLPGGSILLNMPTNIYGITELNGVTWANNELHAQHANTNTSTNAPVVTFGENSLLLRSTSSSKRYKHDITKSLSDELNPSNLYDIDVVQYKFNDNYLDKEDNRANKDVIGFIAEDVAEKYPVAVDFIKDSNGNLIAEDWNYRYIIPAMLKLIQEQKSEIDKLKESISIFVQKGGALSE